MGQYSKPKVKVGVVGCGAEATAHYLPYLMQMETATPVAVCDIDVQRMATCERLFGALQQYQDYHAMIERADIDAVLILTGPGTHVHFTLQAVQAGKHVLLQKPMALTLHDANAIVRAVRQAGVKAVVEPSFATLLDPDYVTLRYLLDQGVLGEPFWFSCMASTPAIYCPAEEQYPHDPTTSYVLDSGSLLFDSPYAPTQIATLLGDCKSVIGMTKKYSAEHFLAPGVESTNPLNRMTNSGNITTFPSIFSPLRSAQAPGDMATHVYSLYEMANGALGVFHITCPLQPYLPDSGVFEIYGAEGNLVFAGDTPAAIMSRRKELLPNVDADGWWHLPQQSKLDKAMRSPAKSGVFNHYHQSTQHLIDCIRDDRDPLLNVEWGRHITEMLLGALESARTGKRYQMTTTLTGLVAAG
ncbi:MAG: Gfo/Idh/MocA family oxidoreductase [Caldilineaceae bacterium]